MKKTSLFSKVLCMGLSLAMLAGCGGGGASSSQASSAAPSQDAPPASTEAPSSESPAPEGGEITIGVSIADQKNPFYTDIVAGMEEVANGKAKLVIMDGNFDQAKQISDIEDMLQQDVDVMLLDPVDGKGVQAALESCKAKGVPVVTFNSAVEDASMVVSNVATDNFMAGQLIGEALGKALEGKGKVGMYTYNVVKVCKDRADGFKDALSKYPDIEIVVEQEGTPGVDTALPAMENILQSHKDLNGMFALNDPSAIGCIAAIESAGKLGEVLVVGVDGSADGISNIKAGKMFASAAQQPLDIGKVAVETALKVVAGETVEADIKIPSFLVDQSNAE